MTYLQAVVLLAAFGQSYAELSRYYINSNEETSVTIPCAANGGDLISANGLYLVHWFRQAVDSRSGNILNDPEEKIIERRADDDDVQNVQKYPDRFSSDPLTGALTIMKGSNEDGTLGSSDQAVFNCRLLTGEKGTEATDAKILLVVVTVPKDRQPTLLDQQPSIDDETNFVFNDGFAGNLVTCQSGHGNPPPEVKWVVYQEVGGIMVEKETLQASTGVFSDNPELHDDDDTDTVHSSELPLSLVEKGGLSSDYDKTTYKCVITYSIAKDGKMTTKSFESNFPADKKDMIRVKHPVKSVFITIDGKKATNDIVDLTYRDDPLIECGSDGYNPGKGHANHYTIQPATIDITSMFQGIKAELKKVVQRVVKVTCTANNDLNKSPVVDTRDFVATYITDIECTHTDGARKRDDVTITCTADSSDEISITIYKNPNIKVRERDIDDEEKANAIIGQLSGIAGVNSDTITDTRQEYIIVAEIVGTGVQRVQTYSFTTSRSNSQPSSDALIEKEPPLQWSKKSSKAVTDPSRIRFWRNTGDINDVKFEEITQRTENDDAFDYPTAGSVIGGMVTRDVPNPAGGQYVVCYDLGDVDMSNGGTFGDKVVTLHVQQEDYCAFFDLEPAAAAGFWWLWILIIIIVIILIAALVWFIRKKKADDAESAPTKEDPSIEATQTADAIDARDEFTQEQETPKETSPMIKQGDQPTSQVAN